MRELPNLASGRALWVLQSNLYFGDIILRIRISLCNLFWLSCHLGHHLAHQQSSAILISTWRSSLSVSGSSQCLDSCWSLWGSVVSSQLGVDIKFTAKMEEEKSSQGTSNQFRASYQIINFFTSELERRQVERIDQRITKLTGIFWLDQNKEDNGSHNHLLKSDRCLNVLLAKMRYLSSVRLKQDLKDRDCADSTTFLPSFWMRKHYCNFRRVAVPLKTEVRQTTLLSSRWKTLGGMSSSSNSWRNRDQLRVMFMQSVQLLSKPTGTSLPRKAYGIAWWLVCLIWSKQ